MVRRWMLTGALVMATLCGRIASGQVVLYVNAAATTGANNGSSWANAFRGEMGLQNALAVATPIAGGGSPVQIWTARGTYKATSDPSDVDASFRLLNSVAVYGGFVGSETQLGQRNPAQYVTTLSGVLSLKFSSFTRHIVRATGTSSTAVLDGVTVSGGSCYFGSADRSGAGLLVTAASPTIAQVRFTGNTAENGGGAAIVGGSPTFTNCLFSGHSARRGGGAANLQGGTPSFAACTFKNNFGLSLGSIGAGLFSDGGSVAVTGSTFDGNDAGAQSDGGGIGCTGGSVSASNCLFTRCGGEAAGGIFSSSATLNLTECTFDQNKSHYGPAAVHATNGASVTARRCVFSGNTIRIFGPGVFVGSGSFVDCQFIGNSGDAGIISGGDYLRCVFRGNSTSGGALISGQRFDECLFVGNTTHPVVSGTVITNCTIANNSTHPNAAVSLQSTSQLLNSVVFNKGPLEVFAPPGAIVRYSTIRGWTGGGVGNNDLNPRFADPLGPDGVAGTADDDLRLLSGSPCIDSADADALPPDTFDLDGDGNVTERLPLDLDGNPRWADDQATPNGGVGFVPYLDRGAYETVPGNSGASALWLTGAGGNFSDPPNWSPGVPGPGGEALFELSGNPVVALSSQTLLRRLSVRAGDFILNQQGHSLHLSDAEYGLRIAPSGVTPQTSLWVFGGSAAPIDAVHTLVRSGGTLTGNFALTGSLDNSGTVRPTWQGRVEGPYKQFVTLPSGQVQSGTLSIQVSGTNPGSYGQLQTPGGYDLLGLLSISASNFNPPNDLHLRILDATGAAVATGRFSAALLPTPPAGPNGEFRFYYITYGGEDGPGSVFLNVGNLGGQIGYGTGVNPANTSSVPTAMALGDVSGDNHPDLVLTLPGSPGAVLVFHNLGTAAGQWLGWSAPTQYTVGNEPGGLAIGDLDGVLGADIAVANTGRQTTPPQAGSVSILVNDGTGNFVVRLPISPDILGESGSAPRGIVIGDLLGGSGSLPDIAIALSGNASHGLILRNEGNFTVVSTQVPFGPRPTSAAIANISNSSGSPDLVSSNIGDGTVSVRFNTPTAPFTTGPTLVAGSVPSQVRAEDLNGDGLPEIITMDEGSNTISVFVNRGGGLFDPRVALPTGSPAAPPSAITILDMDEDQDLDIAFLAGGEADIKVYRNDLNAGQLVFVLDNPVPTPGTALLVGSADVTGDARTDLVPVVNGPSDSPQAFVLANRFRSPCFTANCDGSTGTPATTANDFMCFITAYAAGNPIANCDESTGVPLLTPNDFVCFINAFAAGCP